MFLKSQKNALFNALRDAGIDTQLFELDERNLKNGATLMVEARSEPRFVYKIQQEDGAFTFGGVSAAHIGASEPDELDGDFDDLLTDFREWAHEQATVWADDQEQPDYWSDTPTFAYFPNSESPAAAYEPFTSTEKTTIRRALAAFHERIRKEYKPKKEQDDKIAAELAHLSSMLDRLDRKIDWRGMAFSAIINIATTLALTPDGLRHLGELLALLLKTALLIP